jgi:hypothetical protein
MLTPRAAVLVVFNPSTSRPATLTLDRLPYQRGFRLCGEAADPFESPAGSLSLPPGGEVRLELSFTPNEVGAVREKLSFMWEEGSTRVEVRRGEGNAIIKGDTPPRLFARRITIIGVN